ncbi:hypothetical protein LWI28_028567 [Acer negundo]|uniref:UspA domain-containing protein n=1 Tax=Acer negundo TaxID=4023 RepID=A0AAD5P3H2_ACENE|nr:hypothetical protein LWI28_028567 [Acer negundo]KAK4855187.1 hypothetical protein QYF36_004853 [Acer negundo]
MEGGTPPVRKVMVVADASRESAGALQYALSHVVVEKDELILIHVENPNSWKIPSITSFLRRPSLTSSSATATAAASSEGAQPQQQQRDQVDFLEQMKRVCEVAQPKVRVRTSKVQIMESTNKAAAILSQTEVLRVDLLVIGQRRSLSNVLLGRPGMPLMGTKTADTAEYLIENSKCTCVGVLKKGQNAGYLLNTKTHRNFWLLA